MWSAKVGNPMKPQSDFPMRSPVDHQPHISTPGGARYKWPRSQSWRCQRVSPVLKASQDGVGKCPDVSRHITQILGIYRGYNLQQIRLFWWCSKSPSHGTFTKAWYLDGICGMMWNGSAVPCGFLVLSIVTALSTHCLKISSPNLTSAWRLYIECNWQCFVELRHVKAQNPVTIDIKIAGNDRLDVHPLLPQSHDLPMPAAHLSQ